MRMLEHWSEFYLLIGGASGAFIALLFVAASIGAESKTQNPAAARIYMSPVIVHFTAVLYASAVSLVPSNTRLSFALLIGGGACCTIVYAAWVATRVFRDKAVVTTDRLCYGLTPVIGYAGVLLAAVQVFRGAAWGAEILAGALTLLLIINIRNAWDLTLYVARKRAGGVSERAGE
jgi:hypothetical protein